MWTWNSWRVWLRVRNSVLGLVSLGYEGLCGSAGIRGLRYGGRQLGRVLDVVPRWPGLNGGPEGSGEVFWLVGRGTRRTKEMKAVGGEVLGRRGGTRFSQKASFHSGWVSRVACLVPQDVRAVDTFDRGMGARVSSVTGRAVWLAVR